jgi:hypothetical protein
MSVGRPRVLGLLFLLLALAACTGSAPESEPLVSRADVAVLSYAPPSGAPDFCTELAQTTHLTGLPVAIGTLTADPQDVEARLSLTATVDELRAVRADVPDQPGLLGLSTALDDLLDTLGDAQDAPLTDAVRTAISTRLEAFGVQAQPLCGFPS